MDNQAIKSKLDQVRNNIQSVVIGQDRAIDLLLIALVARGHVLLEDVPGIGKTTLAQALAKSLDLSFNRIQFTPDVMPSDITGFNMYNPKAGEFQFHEGSIMANLVLADEINRSSPKTQSSLLEAMQDRQVTVDGVSYPLPSPFMVVATQNAVEQIGTYPLPEAQLDRFMIKSNLRYPSPAEEVRIYEMHAGISPLDKVQNAITQAELMAIQEASMEVYLAPTLYDYVAQIAAATREHNQVSLGVSPRGALMLVQAAKGRAMVEGRDYCVPEDILTLAPVVLAHRMILHSENELSGRTSLEVLTEIIQSVPAPRQ